MLAGESRELNEPVALPENEFSDVDGSGSSEDLIRYLDLVAELPAIREARKALLRALRLRQGYRVLEVGCGAGANARALAARVGRTGRVVGIDDSASMIEAARQRTDPRLPVEFRHAGATGADFPDNSFDACAMERTLIHLARPRETVVELARVAKSGAAIAAMEVDVESLSVDDRGGGFAAAFKRFVASMFQNPRIGAFLVRYFQDAGLSDITVDAHVAVFRRFGIFRSVLALEENLASAVRAGLATADETAYWVDALAKADADGGFFAAGTIFVVAGRKP